MKEIFNIYNLDENHSCGYHDLSPFSPDEKFLVFCSISTFDFHEKIIFSKKLVNVDIKIINLVNFQIKKIFKTKCYSSEQGVRINWIDNKRISINSLDDFKLPKFIIFNIESMKIEKVIKNYFAHQLTGKQKNISISLDYASIRDSWPSYGFYHESTNLQPSNSLNVYDWVENKLIFRIHLNQIDSYKKYKDGFIIHPTMSEDGKKLLFMHRMIFKNILYSWIYLADIEKNEIKLITEEKVSHFTWINNDQFLLFQRIFPEFIRKIRLNLLHKNSKNANNKTLTINNSHKKISIFSIFKLIFKRVSSGFVLYKIKKNKINKKIISFNLLGIDCHPFYISRRNKVFLDAYPDDKKKVNIFSINLNNKFFAKKEMQIKGDWETSIGKVDAHIRFSHQSNYACIDSVFKKVRVVKIFKIS